MDLLVVIISALWIIAVAYAANAFPPVMRGKRPIDRGKEWKGRRLLGDGKTIEGFLGGVIFGIFIGAILIFFQPYILSLSQQYLTGAALADFNAIFPHLTIEIVVLLSFGALLGDLIGSFIKRRIGLKRGQSAPGMDQLGFAVVAMLLVSPFYHFSLEVVLTILIITPVLHVLTNVLGYVLGLKQVPY